MKGKVFLLVVTVIMVVIACLPPLPTMEVPEEGYLPLPDIKDDEVINQDIDTLLKAFEGKELCYDESTYIFKEESRISLIKVERDGSSWYLNLNEDFKERIITKEEGVFLSDDAAITISSDTIELRKGDNYGRYKIT